MYTVLHTAGDYVVEYCAGPGALKGYVLFYKSTHQLYCADLLHRVTFHVSCTPSGHAVLTLL